MTTNDDQLRLGGTRFEQPSWLVLVEGLRCLTYLQDRFPSLSIGFHGRMGRHVSAWCWHGIGMVRSWALLIWPSVRHAMLQHHQLAFNFAHFAHWPGLVDPNISKFSQPLSSSSKCSTDVQRNWGSTDFYRFLQTSPCRRESLVCMSLCADRSPLSGCALPGGGAATLTAAWQGLDPCPIIVPEFLINPYIMDNIPIIIIVIISNYYYILLWLLLLLGYYP